MGYVLDKQKIGANVLLFLAYFRFTHLETNLFSTFFFISQRATSVNITIMTNAQAKTWCENYMNSSPTFLACQDIPNINSTRAVEICVMDILASEILQIL